MLKKAEGDNERRAYTGQKDRWRMYGAQRETVKDGTSVGGGYQAKTEVVVDGGDHEKGPDCLGLTEEG